MGKTVSKIAKKDQMKSTRSTGSELSKKYQVLSKGSMGSEFLDTVGLFTTIIQPHVRWDCWVDGMGVLQSSVFSLSIFCQKLRCFWCFYCVFGA